MSLAHFRNVILILLVLISASLYFASVIPVSETIEVKAEVVSRTARSGPTGHTGVLICELTSGSRVRVDLPSHAVAKIGDRVVLRTYERYIFGNKYSFAGKLIADG